MVNSTVNLKLRNYLLPKWLPIAFRRLSSQFTLSPDDVTIIVSEIWLKLDSN